MSVEIQDNIATKSEPVWRRRVRTPLTPWAIRQQLITDAAELPESERLKFLAHRLTALDKALSDEAAVALEEWLLCEETLCGRGTVGDYLGSGAKESQISFSPVPDHMFERLRAHAMLKKGLKTQDLQLLQQLGLMMQSRDWDFGAAGRIIFGRQLQYRKAKAKWIEAVAKAATRLVEFV